MRCELSVEAQRNLADAGLPLEGIDTQADWCLALVDWLATTQGDELLSDIAKRWEQYAREEFGV